MAGTPNKPTGDVAPVLIGGFNHEAPATKEIQALVDSVKCDFLKQSGADATQFVAVSYRSQVVAGTNYCVKVDIGGVVYGLKIFKPLPYTGEAVKLTGFQKEKICEDVGHS